MKLKRLILKLNFIVVDRKYKQKLKKGKPIRVCMGCSVKLS